MSRFRRLGLAATAAAAVLALAVPPSASAISINSSGPTPFYNVTGAGLGWTTFMIGPSAVICSNITHGMPVSGGPGWGQGWGLADGQSRTLFVPAFSQPHPTVGHGCWFQDPNGDTSPVSFGTREALALELTGLAPGQNPSSSRREYNGRLFIYEHERFGLSFAPAKYPGCSVKIAGPQSVNLWDPVVVDDNTDRIDIEVFGATFAATKTAACPSTIGNSVWIAHSTGPGWRLNNVTVTP